MTSEQIFVLVILLTVVFAVAIVLVSKNRHRINRVFLNRFNTRLDAGQRSPGEDEQVFGENELSTMTAEESEVELERLQKLIDVQKKIARDTDIANHLWDFYKGFFQDSSPHSLSPYIQHGKWYDVKMLRSSSQNGLNEFEFELSGTKYKFVDDEEKQGWRDFTKIFSLFLYDDSGRCLIEVPIKLKVDGDGSSYSIYSGGPNAFLQGGWIKDFINVKLKQKSIRNQEIRAQKHKERLLEIKDLKEKFGKLD